MNDRHQVEVTTKEDRSIEVQLFNGDERYPNAQVAVHRWGQTLTLAVRVQNSGYAEVAITDAAAREIADALKLLANRSPQRTDS